MTLTETDLIVFACLYLFCLRWWGKLTPTECSDNQRRVACWLCGGPVLPGPVCLWILFSLQSCSRSLQWSHPDSRGQQRSKIQGCGHKFPANYLHYKGACLAKSIFYTSHYTWNWFTLVFPTCEISFCSFSSFKLYSTRITDFFFFFGHP